MTDFIILLVITICVITAVVYHMKNKKSGKSCCGSSCEGCSASCNGIMFKEKDN